VIEFESSLQLKASNYREFEVVIRPLLDISHVQKLSTGTESCQKSACEARAVEPCQRWASGNDKNRGSACFRILPSSAIQTNCPVTPHRYEKGLEEAFRACQIDYIGIS
jgi:hypothetical protein